MTSQIDQSHNATRWISKQWNPHAIWVY